MNGGEGGKERGAGRSIREEKTIKEIEEESEQ